MVGHVESGGRANFLHACTDAGERDTVKSNTCEAERRRGSYVAMQPPRLKAPGSLTSRRFVAAPAAARCFRALIVSSPDSTFKMIRCVAEELQFRAIGLATVRKYNAFVAVCSGAQDFAAFFHTRAQTHARARTRASTHIIVLTSEGGLWTHTARILHGVRRLSSWSHFADNCGTS